MYCSVIKPLNNFDMRGCNHLTTYEGGYIQREFKLYICIYNQCFESGTVSRKTGFTSSVSIKPACIDDSLTLNNSSGIVGF